MTPKKTNNCLIAFYNKKAKGFYSNWNPNTKSPRYFPPSDNREEDLSIRLFPLNSESVVRITYNLDEDWETVRLDYDVFLDLLKAQGIINK